LHKDSPAALAAARQVDRGVAINAGCAVGVIFTGIKMADGGGIDDGIPVLSKQGLEAFGIGDIGLAVGKGGQLMVVRGKLRMEMPTEKTRSAEEKDFQSFGE
jgi:hypothetical protein